MVREVLRYPHPALKPLARERCLQHELDHHDGLLFLDRVDSLTADVFRRKRRG